jgi:uncharacterized membrane protein
MLLAKLDPHRENAMPHQPSPSRLEAFSDGIIAVIITIMVLEFKVPRGPGLAGFVTILPTLAVYALSFTFIGIYWINHHHMVDRLRRVDTLILWMNLLFLFCISLLPFFTNYMVEKHLDPFSIALYAASLFVDGLGFTVLGSAIIRHLKLADKAYEAHEAAEQAAEQTAIQWKGMVSVAMYLVAIPLAFWQRYLAITVVALVTLIWIVPTFGLKPPTHIADGVD